MSIQASWYDQKLEGWYYFEDPNKSSKHKEVTVDEAEDIIEKEKRELKQLLALALVNPTGKNVANYMRYQKQVVDQSNRFAESWKIVLLDDPLLGDFLEQPTNSYAILLKRKLEEQKRKVFLTSSKDTHFILFFFDTNEPFSQKAWEVAQLFGSLHDWKIQPISVSGSNLIGMDAFEVDKGIGLKVGLKATPSFFVVDSRENRVVPVGAGLLTVSELEQNIYERFAQGDKYE
ncbi:MAG: conjugal transfer protein TraF [Rhabdochlamydiaceae bacterium]|nr:conjugal transfer protein TraF [Candidatus Amphrikana amoebophyrae]